jgi:uncharacterized membrane protein YfcA
MKYKQLIKPSISFVLAIIAGNTDHFIFQAQLCLGIKIILIFIALVLLLTSIFEKKPNDQKSWKDISPKYKIIIISGVVVGFLSFVFTVIYYLFS